MAVAGPYRKADVTADVVEINERIKGATYWIGVHENALNTTVQEMLADVVIHGETFAKEKHAKTIAYFKCKIADGQMSVMNYRKRLDEIARAH